MAAQAIDAAGPRRGRRTLVASVSLLLVARAALGALLWRTGWSALSWDDFARAAVAVHWARQPSVIVSPGLIWLPLQTWILGLAFRVTGGLFEGNPLLLAALMNSLAALGTAVFAGLAAWRLFASRAGGLLAFAVVLFAPWSVFTSLSGLAEPFYYLTVAATSWALVEWVQGRRARHLWLGSLAVAAACGLRYEGWLLAVSWLAMVLVVLAQSEGRTLRGVGAGIWHGRALLAAAALPMIVPAAWLAASVQRYGDPLGFARAIAVQFAVAYGPELTARPASVFAYYLLSLFRSAPLLLTVLVAVAAWTARASRPARALIGVFALQLLLFCSLSARSGTLGAFNERFMFAFVVGLCPLLGALPGLLLRAGRGRSVLLALTLGAAAALATAHALAHPPDEWRHPPDLLELGSRLSALRTADGHPPSVVLGRGHESEWLPLSTWAGRRMSVRMASATGLVGPPTLAPGVDVWIERTPARVDAIPVGADAVVGRFHAYGPLAAGLRRESDALAHWERLDEDGRRTQMARTGVLALEFTTDDPPPGADVVLEQRVKRGPAARQGSIRVRAPFGHGFRYGRFAYQVLVDGRLLFQDDTASPSRWHTVPFEIPGGAGRSLVTVRLLAATPERGVGWGRWAIVLVDRFELAER